MKNNELTASEGLTVSQKLTVQNQSGARARGAVHDMTAKRAARIAAPVGRGWARKNLTAAGVTGAPLVDKIEELESVARGVHFRAAAYASAIINAPLPACVGLVARGLTHGRTDNLGLATVARGRRDPLPGGRTAAARAANRHHRARAGIVWPWAAREAVREMGRNLYATGGRDGREVAAGWHLSGTVDGATYGEVHFVGDVIPRGTATRRPQSVASIRAALAASLRDAREGMTAARWQGMQAVTPTEKIAAGAAIGGARRSMETAKAAVRNLRAALEGEALDPSAVSRWLSESGAMTSAGRMFAKRFRDSRAADHVARIVAGKPAKVAAVTVDSAAAARAFAKALESRLG